LHVSKLLKKAPPVGDRDSLAPTRFGAGFKPGLHASLAGGDITELKQRERERERERGFVPAFVRQQPGPENSKRKVNVPGKKEMPCH